MDNQSILPAIWIAIVSAACLTFFIYLLFFDKDSSHDVEIDNIYRQLEDNSKMQDEINSDLRQATTHYYDEFLEADYMKDENGI